MKRKQFTEEQIITILEEHEAGAVMEELCRKHRVGESTVYRWKAKYGGMGISEIRRLKALGGENTKLKRLLANTMLDNTALQEVLGGKMVTPAENREAVGYFMASYGASERRACQVLACCRMTIRYQAVSVDDTDLRDRLKALAREQLHFGYRRLHELLRREGYHVNHKRVYRIYREEGLHVQAKGARSELSVRGRR